MSEGKVKRYLFSPLEAVDEQKFGYKVGDHKGQQCWEALVLLVAVNYGHHGGLKFAPASALKAVILLHWLSRPS